MKMKRIPALMVLLLLIAANTAFAQQNYDATFTLTGYEIGKEITEIGVEVDNPNCQLRRYPLSSGAEVNVMVGTYSSGMPIHLTEGVFEEGTEYFIEICFYYDGLDGLSGGEVDTLLQNAKFCLSDGSVAVKTPYYKPNKVCGAIFWLPVLRSPVQETTLPKTGDKSSILLWSALACISLFGMTMLARKKKEA